MYDNNTISKKRGKIMDPLVKAEINPANITFYSLDNKFLGQKKVKDLQDGVHAVYFNKKQFNVVLKNQADASAISVSFFDKVSQEKMIKICTEERLVGLSIKAGIVEGILVSRKWFKIINSEIQEICIKAKKNDYSLIDHDIGMWEWDSYQIMIQKMKQSYNSTQQPLLCMQTQSPNASSRESTESFPQQNISQEQSPISPPLQITPSSEKVQQHSVHNGLVSKGGYIFLNDDILVSQSVAPALSKTMVAEKSNPYRLSENTQQNITIAFNVSNVDPSGERSAEIKQIAQHILKLRENGKSPQIRVVPDEVWPDMWNTYMQELEKLAEQREPEKQTEVPPSQQNIPQMSTTGPLRTSDSDSSKENKSKEYSNHSEKKQNVGSKPFPSTNYTSASRENFNSSSLPVSQDKKTEDRRPEVVATGQKDEGCVLF